MRETEQNVGADDKTWPPAPTALVPQQVTRPGVLKWVAVFVVVYLLMAGASVLAGLVANAASGYVSGESVHESWPHLVAHSCTLTAAVMSSLAIVGYLWLRYGSGKLGAPPS